MKEGRQGKERGREERELYIERESNRKMDT